MVTYSIEDAQTGSISYSDRKRYLWLISVIMPTFPLMGVFIFYQTGLEWTLCLPLIINYIAMPILDWLIGSDNNNPPEELVPQLEADKYYRYLTYATVPMHFIVLVSLAYVVGTNDLSWWSILVTAIIAGGYSGLGINTAHELGHKQTSIEQLLSKITLAVPTYGHFCVEHNRGHHVLVATPDDPASSRMGESIYAFTLREIPGTFKRGWNLEKSRLSKQGKSTWSIHNDILQSYALSTLLQGALISAFGWVMVPFLAVHNVWAWYQLTSANYIEHYGLLREQKENGRYERCQPHHSWNANYIMSNLALFHLERHSDHHANPIRRYQSLRNFKDIPELPNGYYGMYLLAYIPWLWYRVMDHRVLALPHIDGDLSKVNICPRKRDQIFAKYGTR
ncbi:MAG: alkane 1-monooxygenase [Porticoccaceae bacterium]|nr:alkane 1-monooxygenase [Porticoccaceae bacterium]